jgi:hypothetical protein
MKKLTMSLCVVFTLAFANALTAQTSPDAAPAPPPNGATNFVATNSTQVVNVTQRGSGVAIVGFAPTNTAIIGQTQGTAGSYAILGIANGSSGAGTATGVRGVSTLASGLGVVGKATGASGVGVWGDTTGASGVAGYFDNISGGNILIGAVNGVYKFRVDGTGKGFFDGGTQTGGADFAESVAAAPMRYRYEPGDLLMVDTTAKRQLRLAAEPYSTLVAGIYSTKPGVLATIHKGTEPPPPTEIPLAILGIVPCKVSAENGAVKAGDLLVTSSTPGYAMKGTDRQRMLGAVVGKALEPLADGKGMIQVLVTLQ